MSDYDSLMNTLAASSNYSSEPTAVNRYANYHYAADSHNYGNSNWAITDPTTWGTAVGNGAKMVIAAAASGINSFYNTGVTVANWFGADAKENDVGVQLAALDSDLGAYYRDNKDAADLAGFVMTSLIPGIGGVKLLNAGQKVLRGAAETGMIGGNLGKAVGLLTPKVDTYRALAAADIAQSAATFSLTKGNTLKAIGAGYGQAALESAAFEIAVSATMFKSPVLEDTDGWDIAKNIMTGSLVGGVIGGAFTHASTMGAIKKKVLSLNPAEKLYTDTSNLVGLTPAQQIVVRQERLVTMPAAPLASEIADGTFSATQQLLKDVPARDIQAVSEQMASKLSRMRSETELSLLNKNRESFHTLTSGDKELGNQLADLHQTMSANQSQAALTNVEGFSRLNVIMPQEKLLEKALKKQADDIVTNGIDSIANSELPFKIGYVKLAGEGTGNVSFEAPRVFNLADTLPTKEAVMNKVASYKFKENKIFDPMADGISHFDMEARYIWADRQAIVTNGMKIGEWDIPLLEKAIKSKLDTIEVVSAKGNYTINSFDDLYKHTIVSKQELAAELVRKSAAGGTNAAGNVLTTEEIAKVANIKNSFIEGERTADLSKDFFARQQHQEQYKEYLKSSGVHNAERKAEDFVFTPSYSKVAYNTSNATENGFVLSGMAHIKSQQKLYQQSIDNAMANHIPTELIDQFWHPTDDVLMQSNRYGAGPGIVSFANGGYHTPESWAESIGSATSRLQRHFKDTTTEKLQNVLYKLKSNSEAAIEFESINKKIMSTPEHYGINPEGTGIEPLKMLDYKAALARGDKTAKAPELFDGTQLFIPFKTEEAAEAWIARTELTSNRTKAFADIRNAQGLEDLKDPRALRPIRQDPKEYQYYAVVTDPTVTGVGHKSMIHATSAQELDSMIAKVPKQFEVYKGDQLKQFFKSQGEFDYELSLHENYIDSSLKRSGVNNPFFVRTEPQLITESFLKDHLRSDDIFSRELINAKFEKEFSFLRQQGEQFTSSATSKYTGSYKDIENTIDNPYTNYIKTALNISQVNEHPLLVGLNNKLDAAVSKGWKTITDAFGSAKSPEDLVNVNAALNKFGVTSAYRDAATDLLANHTAPKGVLSKFVMQANSIVSTLVTRLDPFNAINNMVGANVLYGTELNSFLKAMKNPDSELAGKLSGLLKSPAPVMENITAQGIAAGGGEQMTSAGTLLKNAYKNFFNKEATAIDGTNLHEFYKANGWTTRLHDQFHSMMDDLTLVGNENVGVLNQKINSAFKTAKELADKGERFTGNKFAEEFNRFVAADTMRQLTDLGVQAGRISVDEAKSYINTFVNRTQGNVLASQRPLMFQGPIGQAVGLFQTFQFNTMQQLFRHVAEGAPKDAAMLLGLQGTMYGMNGLPAFNFINTHIVGTMSGNPKHIDAYSATYGIAGKNIGDLLLYGVPSNLLRANLYTRGDINPRTMTVIPTNPADIAFVQAIAKTYSNTRDMLNNMNNGGNIWKSLLSGIEHNGISRPLAGIAQTVRSFGYEGNVFSIDNKGTISGANDLMSWATATRIAGAKPLNDSIVNDAVFRYASYQASDRNKLEKLNKMVKLEAIAGGDITAERMDYFAAQYAATGGQQKNFNKYIMLQIKEANTMKANKIAASLNNPFSHNMQQIMGGSLLEDGNSF